ncbi:hypothetical protein KAR91_57705 [Candidatus Pacearchaeota archaeon]|nr:hypothetical protein [Candidatus Pacearchaeota archaeon]
MTSKEFRELQHGDKINSPDGLNFIVHNNHRSGNGMVVTVRTEIIYSRFCSDWSITKKHTPVNIQLTDGIYEVQVVRRIE